MNRRELLKATAMAAAAAAASRLAGRSPATAAPGPDGITWDKAPCRFCGTGCHVQVGVRDRKVVAIAGDQKADVNKGLLCVKGYHVALALYGADRLTTPLLRQNGRLVPISWDKALDVIADRVMANPSGFAIYGSGQWTIPEGYAAQKLIKAGLANNQIDPNARLCMASAVTGFLSTYGVDEPAGCYEDLDRCDTLVIWGNNPAEMHPVLFSRVIDRRLRGQRGAEGRDNVTIVDLTTRRTRTSGFSDRTILFSPQGDLAIANGIAHLLLARGTWDRSFVERYCNFRKRTNPPTLEGQASTFDEYKAALAEYTPARVEQLAGVARADLEYLADLFGDRTRRITSLWCMGPNQHTRGTAINDLIHGIHLLSGHFGKPGDAPTSLTGQPSACGTVREVGTLAHALPGGLVVANAEHRREAEQLWNLPAGRINAKPGHHTVELWRRFSTANSDIDTIWVQVTNPARSLPNINELFEPSRKLPGKFLIVSDVYPTATVQAADLVLPSAMWVEKNGMVGNSERRTQQWFKMVPPPGQARDDCWQTIAVARRLHDRGHAGMKDKDGRFLFHVADAKGNAVPIWDWARYYDVNVDEHLFEEYRAFTRHKHKDLAPYKEYVAARGLRWPVVKQANGSWRETKFRFARADDPYATKADIQFYHSVTKDDRALIWFHPWEAPPESPDTAYPFWLSTGRVLEHWHTGTMTMRVPQLQRAMPQAYCELHREDARRLGIADGEIVVIESRRGKVELPVWIDGRGQPSKGTVFVPFFDETIAINRVTLDAHDPLSKQPDYKKCAVRIRKR